MTRELIVNVVLFRLHEERLQVLLTAPTGENSQGISLAIPAASPNDVESLEDTANLLITNLINRRETYLEQLFTYGERDQPARIVYFALVTSGARLFPGDWHAGFQPRDSLFYRQPRLMYLPMLSGACVTSWSTARSVFNSCRENSRFQNSSIPTRSSLAKSWTSATSAGACCSQGSLRKPRDNVVARGARRGSTATARML